MGRKKRRTPLPAAGTAFAVPLEDGRFGACRVIRRSAIQDAEEPGAESVLVACSAWIGNAVPEAHAPDLRPVLHLKHHSWNGDPEILWVSEPPPNEFIPIGTIEATEEEKAIECLRYGGWSSFQVQPLAQWRWDNDRGAVLSKDKIKDKVESQRRMRNQQVRKEYLANVTLEDLRDHQFFPQWDEYPPKKAIRASRHIMTETVRRLTDLGPTAPESQRIAALKDCIEQFNAIDVEMDHFIETIEREDICEEFEAIVHACGLGTHQDLADNWRDW